MKQEEIKKAIYVLKFNGITFFITGLFFIAFFIKSSGIIFALGGAFLYFLSKLFNKIF
jgi:hypothetical protein